MSRDRFVAHLIQSFSRLSMKITPSTQPPIRHEEISARARELWQKNGSPEGRDDEFWLAAEHELTRDREDVAQEQNGDVTPPRSTPSGGEALHEVTSGPAASTRRARRPGQRK
jgi:hypothetical protein